MDATTQACAHWTNVAEGYTWVVYAEDADGNLLAVSPLRPIAP